MNVHPALPMGGFKMLLAWLVNLLVPKGRLTKTTFTYVDFSLF